MSMPTTNGCHHEPRNDLGLIIASGARVAMLEALLPDPSPSFYQRQLEAATGLPLRAVQRELERLTAAGLLFRRTEGNRAYYQVNQDSPLFAELRALVLKAAGPALRLRAAAAANPSVRLCLLSAGRDRALAVHRDARRPALRDPDIAVGFMTAEAFLAALRAGDAETAAFLREGTDLLGRREDLLWRHVEAAGHNVKKEHGVP